MREGWDPRSSSGTGQRLGDDAALLRRRDHSRVRLDEAGRRELVEEHEVAMKLAKDEELAKADERAAEEEEEESSPPKSSTRGRSELSDSRLSALVASEKPSRVKSSEP